MVDYKINEWSSRFCIDIGDHTIIVLYYDDERCPSTLSREDAEKLANKLLNWLKIEHPVPKDAEDVFGDGKMAEMLLDDELSDFAKFLMMMSD